MEDRDNIPQDSTRLSAADVSLSAPSSQHQGDSETGHARSSALSLARLSDMVNASGDLAAVCEAVVEEAGRLFEADAASVFLTTGSRYLKHMAGFGLSPEFIIQVEEIAATETTSQFLSGDRGPIIVRDVRQDHIAPTYLKLIIAEGISSLASFPLRNMGNLLGFVTLYHENTRDYADEDSYALRTFANLLALSVANVQFTEAKQGEDKARDRFLNALSHELRTPLTSIMGFTQVIRKRLSNAPGTDARLRDQLEVLWTQAQRLNRLIDTFVDLANIERGEFEINLGKVDLATVLRSAVTQALGQARSRQHVETQISDSIILVHGDNKRLEQVFTHIVSNALRYSPPEQPILVQCHLEKMQGRVVVVVSDSGPGISPHARKNIFERSNPGDAQRSGGLGVGLYLSKTVVEAHGGHISIQSSPAGGASITIVLPV